jgi:hypothetical protein
MKIYEKKKFQVFFFEMKISKLINDSIECVKATNSYYSILN